LSIRLISRFALVLTRGKRRAITPRSRHRADSFASEIRLRKSISAALLVLSLAGAAGAQVQDTIAGRTPLFTGRDAMILSGFTVGTIAVAPLDVYLAEVLQNPGAQQNNLLGNSATAFKLLGVPGTIGIGLGLYVFGRINDQRRVQDLGLHSTEAVVISTAVAYGIKVLAGRARPYLDVRRPHDFQLGRGISREAYRSFPSGHTTAAFAFAAAVSRETQLWWPGSRWYIGTAAYAGATLVGVSRMYDNVHWASDVLGGAAIGTLVGLKVVKYSHSHPGNRIDRVLLKGNRSPPPAPIPLITFQFR
jgi:membrane-associated phospholipid phosphatase